MSAVRTISLAQAADALAAETPGAEAYRRASQAFIAAVGGREIAAWDAASRAALLRRLIRQDDCPVRPHVFAHEVASAISTGNRRVAAAVAKETLPALDALLTTAAQDDPAFGNAVLLLLVIRSFARGAVPRRRIGRLHREWFARFAREDLALPYSVMFNAAFYGENRNEALAAYPPASAAALGDVALRPWHLTFLEWLSGEPYFRDPDNADLERFLAARAPFGQAEDLAHARTLVLRHFRPGGRLGPERLAALGLDDIAEPARRQAELRARQAPARPPRRWGATLLQSRPYQAAQLAFSMAAARAPALARRSRPRVAVCVSGQLRGYVQALASWRRSLLLRIEPVFFVHVWEQVGRSDAQPFRQELPFAGLRFRDAYRREVSLLGYDAAQARYPTLFARLAGGALADRDALAALYGTDDVVLEDDRASPFTGYSNPEKMHYKIHAAHARARMAGDFDLFVRIRPDLEVRAVAFDWRDLQEAAAARPVLYAEKAPGLHYGSLMVGDQCAIASQRTMDAYAETWESFPRLVAAAPGGCPTKLAGHVSLALTCWQQGIAMEKAPIRFGRLLEAERMSCSEVVTALEADLAGSRRADATDEALLAAARRDMAEAAARPPPARAR